MNMYMFMGSVICPIVVVHTFLQHGLATPPGEVTTISLFLLHNENAEVQE